MHDSLLIQNGRVLDPASGFDAVADVLINDGVVVAIETSIDATAEKAIDATDCIVTPGLFDPHVHLREPGGEPKETIESGTRAAVAGGFTSVACMPNTSPTLDSTMSLNYVRLRAEETGACRVFVVAAATMGRQGQTLAPIGELAEAGAIAISDDGDVIANASMMRAVMQTCAVHDIVFMQHAQEPTLTVDAAMHEGAVSARLGLRGWPAVAEELIVERDVRLVAETGCRYHVQHVSSAGTVAIIRQARAAGLPVSGEASPHHLLLTDEACEGYDTNAKMNPPIRSADDMHALREGVADGTITVLATDHAPHTAAEKARDFAQAPFGIIGLEGALGLYHKALVETDLIDWPRLIALMTIEPARLVGVDTAGIGRLAVGLAADITVIDPQSPAQINVEQFESKSRNSPFDGWNVTPSVRATIVAGRPTEFERSELTAC